MSTPGEPDLYADAHSTLDPLCVFWLGTYDYPVGSTKVERCMTCRTLVVEPPPAEDRLGRWISGATLALLLIAVVLMLGVLFLGR